MRVHIELDDDLIARVDARAGSRGRSAFVRRAVTQALDREERWDLIEAALGSIQDTGHEWDADPDAWVRAGRRSDERRIG